MIDSGSGSDDTVFGAEYDCATLLSKNSVKNVTWMENTWNRWMENSVSLILKYYVLNGIPFIQTLQGIVIFCMAWALILAVYSPSFFIQTHGPTCGNVLILHLFTRKIASVTLRTTGRSASYRN